MKVHFKLMVLLLCTALTTSIQAQNEPFVDGLPEVATPAEAIAYLKLAMQGKPIPGAKVNCTKANYTAVISELAYNEMLEAPVEKFSAFESDGTEQNNGINTSGNTAPGKILKAGQRMIGFTASNGEKVKIKWGQSHCLNPQGPLLKVAIVHHDPDEQEDKPKGVTPAGGGNQQWVINNIMPSNASGGDDLKWVNGFKDGFTYRTNALLEDNLVFQSWKSNCCTTNQQIQPVQPQVQTIQTAYVPQPVQQVYIQPKKGFGDTWLGHATAYTVGGLLEDGVERLFGSNNNTTNVIYQQPITPVRQGYNYTNLNPEAVYVAPPPVREYNNSQLSFVDPNQFNVHPL